MKQKLKIGFSTCPNDTFIFDALVNNKIDTGNFEFDVMLADVEELNKMAFNKQLDITKLSFHAFTHISDKYEILTSGSALGYENGPLLISKRKIYPDEIKDVKIAIPGKYTTANLLLSIAYPEAKNKIEYLFSDIEDAVLSNEVDAGLIIHENRFTYEEKGLIKIIDLGEFWQNKFELPIPLGGIVINKKLENNIKTDFNALLKKSIEFAFEDPSSSYEYVKKYAQEIDREIIYNHIQLYVNEFTLELGDIGKQAILKLFNEAEKLKLISNINDDIFVS